MLAGAANAAPGMLRDQFGNSDGLVNYKGMPVLAIVVTTRKLRWIGRWEEALRAEIPQLTSIRIADVSDEPPPDYAAVAELLLKHAPAGISVLIDLQNLWAKSHALDTDEPCLVIFDADQNLVAKFRGRPKAKLVNEVLAALRPYYPLAKES